MKEFTRRIRARFLAVSWRDLAITVGPIAAITIALLWITFQFIQPAPPRTVVMSSGPAGSAFHNFAERYRALLAAKGITLEVRSSSGSLENLKRLINPKGDVDVGFVQGGVAGGLPIARLVSLGSVFHQPVAVYYRAPGPIYGLSYFKGKRVAIGPEGSGTRVLALNLLDANGITPGAGTQLSDLSGEAAAQALIDRKVDAVFLMGDSATPPTLRALYWTPGVRLLDFRQADAFTRRFPYLSQRLLPMGALDLGKNVPEFDVHMIGPTVELIARENLHPALSDVLIEAAQSVHGTAGLMRRAGEFPAPLEHEYRLSDDAQRYYKSGKGFFYRHLPFWLASLVDRTLILLLPLFVVLFPAVRLVPWLYSWRVRSRLYRWYGALISLERSVMADATAEERARIHKRLDEIEGAVNRLRVPLAFADQFYVLREHIAFVRRRLEGSARSSAAIRAA